MQRVDMVQRVEKSRPARQRKTKIAIAASALAMFFVVVIAQPAAAYYATYAYNVSVSYLQTKTSSALPGLKGGRVSNPTGISLSGLFLQIRTYSSYPGYTLHGSASGGSPGWVYLSHGTVDSSAYSQCNWAYWTDIGPIRLTCQYSR